MNTSSTAVSTTARIAYALDRLPSDTPGFELGDSDLVGKGHAPRCSIGNPRVSALLEKSPRIPCAFVCLGKGFAPRNVFPIVLVLALCEKAGAPFSEVVGSHCEKSAK